MFLFFTQQVMKEQLGCLSWKPMPAHPGQREGPSVQNSGHNPQSRPQTAIVGYRFTGCFFRSAPRFPKRRTPRRRVGIKHYHLRLSYRPKNNFWPPGSAICRGSASFMV